MARFVAAGGHSISLQGKQSRVGASPQNEIPIVGALGLSATHFVVQEIDSRHLVTPAAADATTKVNGQAVSGLVNLAHGDVVEAGQLQLRYESEDSPSLPSFSVTAIEPTEPVETSSLSAPIDHATTSPTQDASSMWLRTDDLPPPEPEPELSDEEIDRQLAYSREKAQNAEKTYSFGACLLVLGIGCILIPNFGWQFSFLTIFGKYSTFIGPLLVCIGILCVFSTAASKRA